MWPLLPRAPASRLARRRPTSGSLCGGRPPRSRSCDLPASPCTARVVDPRGPSGLPLPGASAGLPRPRPVPVPDRLTTAVLATRPVRRTSRKLPSACHAGWSIDDPQVALIPAARLGFPLCVGRRFRWRERVLVPRLPDAQEGFANILRDTPRDLFGRALLPHPSLPHRRVRDLRGTSRQLNTSLRRKCRQASARSTAEKPTDHSAPRAICPQAMVGASASAQAYW